MATASIPSIGPFVGARDTVADEHDSTFDLLAVLTIVLMMMHAPGIWYTRTPLIAFLICGLIKRELTRLPIFWFSISGLIAADVITGWFFVDNHKFVELYWCLTMFCIASAPLAIREEVRTMNARWMLGAVMLFAVLWKGISYSYMSGQFFEFTLLTDVRFQHMAHWFGGIEYGLLQGNRETLSWFKTFHLQGGVAESALIESNAGIRRLALFMTWWTILIEGFIGLLYVLPARIKHIGFIRDYSLLAFAATTYLFAPVVGFGWLLMIMGIAQTDSPFRRRLFVVAFVLIQVYEMPYSAIVNNFVG